MNLIDQLNIGDVRLTESGFESRMELGSFHAQPQGYLNGGATLAFCEAIAGMASNQLEKGSFAVGQSISANHLNPKKSEGYVIARGTLLHGGKHSHTWEIKVTDEAGLLISQVTVLNHLAPRKE